MYCLKQEFTGKNTN